MVVVFLAKEKIGSDFQFHSKSLRTPGQWNAKWANMEITQNGNYKMLPTYGTEVLLPLTIMLVIGKISLKDTTILTEWEERLYMK